MRPTGRIRAPKRTAADDEKFTKASSVISNAIRHIYQHDVSHLSFEEHYRNSYNMVIHKAGDRLYFGVRDVLTIQVYRLFWGHFKHSLSSTNSPSSSTQFTNYDELLNNEKVILGSESTKSDGQVLKWLQYCWQEHTLAISMIKDILMYLDKVFVSKHGLIPVYEMGLLIFRDVVLNLDDSKVLKQLQEALLYQIHLERKGELIDSAFVKTMIQMLVDIDYFKQVPGISGVKPILEKCQNNDPQIMELKSFPEMNEERLYIVSEEMDSKQEDKANLKSSLYYQLFEPALIQETENFYKSQSVKLLSSISIANYVKKVEEYLRNEEERTHQYFLPSTEVKLKGIVEKEMITHHISILLNCDKSGLPAMVKEDAYQDLARLYKQVTKVDQGAEMMRTKLHDIIVDHGHQLQLDYQQKQSLSRNGSPQITSSHYSEIFGLMRLHSKFQQLLKNAFDGDKYFETSNTLAFEQVVNKSEKVPEYLSLFMDEHIRKSSKGRAVDDVEDILDQAVMLFKYIHDKDIFEKYYKQHLAKRLLAGKYTYDDNEQSMISKLKAECGYQFTTKLEGMFNDMEICEEMGKEFKNYDEYSSMGIDLSVRVLTSTFWPTINTNLERPSTSEKEDNFITNNDKAMSTLSSFLASSGTITEKTVYINRLLVKACQVFKNFYSAKHTGRKLLWQLHMGTADVRARFKKSKHELNVSTYQMIILLLFSDLPEDRCLTLQEIVEQTNIPASELNRHLQTLACGKFRIITRLHSVKDMALPIKQPLDESDRFKVNIEFTHPLARIKIPMIAYKNAPETEPQQKETKSQVDASRKQLLEATIVRIMKGRKKLHHAPLVAETASQLSDRFLPDPQDVKKRIEVLIEKEYLCRDEHDRTLYHYLA